MSSRTFHSKASIKGHPIHAMLVSFPIALYTSGVVALIVYASTRDTFWYRASFTLLLAGAAMAALSAVFGVIDLFFAIPRNERRARTTGLYHMGLNVGSLVLFGGAGLSLLSSWRHASGTEVWLPFQLPLAIGIVGMGLTLAAGWLGYNLVQKHHVGVEELELPEKRVASATVRP